MTEHDRTLLSLIRQVRAQRRSQPDALEGERLRLEGSLIEFVEEAWPKRACPAGIGSRGAIAAEEDTVRYRPARRLRAIYPC